MLESSIRHKVKKVVVWYRQSCLSNYRNGYVKRVIEKVMIAKSRIAGTKTLIRGQDMVMLWRQEDQ